MMTHSVEVIQFGRLSNNVYFVSKNGEKDTIMIDCGEAPDLFLEHIAKNELSIHAILFTHTHYDHLLGLPQFLEQYSQMPAIYVHESELKFLTDGIVNPEGWMVKGPFPQLDPSTVTTMKDGDHFSLAGMDISVIHTPGHSPGCVCFEIDKKLLFTGDTVFSQSVGRTDLPGSDPAAMDKSIDKVKRLDGSLICYPGHNDYEFTLRDRFL